MIFAKDAESQTVKRVFQYVFHMKDFEAIWSNMAEAPVINFGILVMVMNCRKISDTS